MKKAQWKQDPRERSFGKDPRDVLNDNLTKALHEANEKIAVLKETGRDQRAILEQQRDQLLTRNKRERAYTWLRAKGVVVEDEGEFKHLQGSDMDAFFKITEDRKVALDPALGGGFFGTTPTSLLAPASMKDQALRLIQMEFKKAYQQHITEHLTWQALPK